MNFSWGNAFSDNLIKGYNFGKALRTDLAANEYASDIEEADKNYAIDKELLGKERQFYDENKGNEAIRLGAIESAAGIGANTPGSTADDYEGTDIDALRAKNATAISREMTDAPARFAATETRNTANRDKAKRSALAKYYRSTGQVDLADKTESQNVWLERLQNPEVGAQYLLEQYNSKLPNGQRYQIDGNGTLSLRDASGQLLQANIPIPSAEAQQSMLFESLGREMVAKGDSSLFKMLQDQKLADRKQTETERAALAKEAIDTEKIGIQRDNVAALKNYYEGLIENGRQRNENTAASNSATADYRTKLHEDRKNQTEIKRLELERKQTKDKARLAQIDTQLGLLKQKTTAYADSVQGLNKLREAQAELASAQAEFTKAKPGMERDKLAARVKAAEEKIRVAEKGIDTRFLVTSRGLDLEEKRDAFKQQAIKFNQQISKAKQALAVADSERKAAMNTDKFMQKQKEWETKKKVYDGLLQHWKAQEAKWGADIYNAGLKLSKFAGKPNVKYRNPDLSGIQTAYDPVTNQNLGYGKFTNTQGQYFANSPEEIEQVKQDSITASANGAVLIPSDELHRNIFAFPEYDEQCNVIDYRPAGYNIVPFNLIGTKKGLEAEIKARDSKTPFAW